jgi:hypothetical protein
MKLYVFLPSARALGVLARIGMRYNGLAALPAWQQALVTKEEAMATWLSQRGGLHGTP